jgi:UDP-glucose 4-epimerase
MRALVTGGGGFIGSNLAALLIAHRHEVVVLDDFSSGHRENIPGGASLIEGDLRDHHLVERAVSGCEVVFHLAASVGNARSIAEPIHDSEVNVLGTLRVLEASRHLGVRKVVFSSSAGVFGELKTLPIREDHPVEPDSPYGASKLGAEKLCLAYAKLYPLECVCLRYFNVYGPNQRYDAYGNVIPIFARRMLRDEAVTIFGDGEQTRDFVNVRDVAEANYRAGMARSVSGAFNIGSATRISIGDLARQMYETLGRPPRLEYAPPRPGDVRHSLADISAARGAFEYVPRVELHDGLAEYLAWASAAGVAR